MVSRNSSLIVSTLFATLLSASSYTAFAEDNAPPPAKKLTLAQQWEARVKASQEESDKRVADRKKESMADTKDIPSTGMDQVKRKQKTDEELAASQKAFEARKQAPTEPKHYKPYDFKKPVPKANDTRSPQEQWKAKRAEAAKAAETKKAEAVAAKAAKVADSKAAEAQKAEAAAAAAAKLAEAKAEEAKKAEATEAAASKAAEAAKAAEAKKAEAAAAKAAKVADAKAVEAKKAEATAEAAAKKAEDAKAAEAAVVASGANAEAAPVHPGSNLHGPEATKQRDALLARGRQEDARKTQEELKKFHKMEQEVAAEEQAARASADAGDEPMARATKPPTAPKGGPKILNPSQEKSDDPSTSAEKPTLTLAEQLAAERARRAARAPKTDPAE